MYLEACFRLKKIIQKKWRVKMSSAPVISQIFLPLISKVGGYMLYIGTVLREFALLGAELCAQSDTT